MENKNLVKCKACDADIAKSAKKCPHCGEDQRNFFMRYKVLSIIIILIVLAGIGSALNNENDKITTTNFTRQDTANTKTSTSTLSGKDF
ncbi:zinc ribbon domain-containing protein [Clostridium kluyveri]|uniref:zinc ribbon domain-containing protein n=1 Tax=Clostridium kluyveri TaxID=1534 RepID=UPI0002FABDB0|nr:zinc ribbon domain-containing protein [Clostridium kluyveri]